MAELPSFKSFYDRQTVKDTNSLGQLGDGILGQGKSKAEQSTELTPNTKTRQQQPGGMTRSTHIVPHSHQVKPHHIPGVERMKNEPIWSTVGQDLDDASLNRVLAQYRMNPNNLADLKPKNLGNGEQRIAYNPNTGNWRIEKRKI